MPNLTQNAEPAKIISFDCLQQMDLVFKIETAITGNQNAIALGIKSCIDNNVPAWKIIKEVQMMIEDNYTSMSCMLGDVLTDSIINFK